ncbi:MAG: sensor domain-containing diguanylate cyclase [Acidobacteriota bacterium]
MVISGEGIAVTDHRWRTLSDPETLRGLVRNLREGIYITNAAGEILDANPAFLGMFGVGSLEELRALHAQDLIVDPAQREAETLLLARESAVRDFEFQIRRPDGVIRTVLDTCYAVADEATGEVLYHGMLIDISRRKELERQLRELSVRDPLTWTYNRHFLAQLERTLDAETGATWGAIVVDIDHFKEINDRLGHSAGDEVLVRLGRFLVQRVRLEDAIIRTGGDEFLVLLAGVHADSTEEVARRLREVAPVSAPVSFSLGWAMRRRGESVHQTISRADRQLIAVRMRERRRRAPAASQPPDGASKGGA